MEPATLCIGLYLRIILLKTRYRDYSVENQGLLDDQGFWFRLYAFDILFRKASIARNCFSV